MNITGIGVDIVEVKRFRNAADKYGELFLKKIFTPREIEYARVKKGCAMHMSGKFAAKEAVKKALPDGARIGLSWMDIEILNDSDGKPYAALHGKAKMLMENNDLANVFVSISHIKNYAISNAVAVKNGT